MPVLQLALVIFSHCLVASAIREFDQKSFQVLQADQQPRSDGILPCTSASTLRALLLQLGIPEEDLKNQNPHQVDGITSDGCQVTKINFRGRELHGTLPQELGELPELKTLSLFGTKIRGDLSALKSATKLQRLNLYGTAVAGNLKSLEKATELQVLNLQVQGTAVAGNLKSLEKATKLKVLDLQGTAVAGNLEPLEKATELQMLNLQGTAVAGNLKSLEKATKLQYLNLRGTAVAGNLESLEEAMQLQQLKLSGTAVAGNLKSLEKATELQWLFLRGTAVAGNLESLEEATKLRELYLSGTAVAGDFSVLLRFAKIGVVDLGGTQVHGSLSEAWRGGCPKLRSLTLSDAWQGWFQQSRVQRPYIFAYMILWWLVPFILKPHQIPPVDPGRPGGRSFKRKAPISQRTNFVFENVHELTVARLHHRFPLFWHVSLSTIGDPATRHLLKPNTINNGTPQAKAFCSFFTRNILHWTVFTTAYTEQLLHQKLCTHAFYTRAFLLLRPFTPETVLHQQHSHFKSTSVFYEAALSSETHDTSTYYHANHDPRVNCHGLYKWRTNISKYCMRATKSDTPILPNTATFELPFWELFFCDHLYSELLFSDLLNLRNLEFLNYNFHVVKLRLFNGHLRILR